ncbi:hypothetical protein F5Y18DRAFT_429458 [Xylariaceae sp. FL1019]|nr:hypothetical protein F5Y18DRAFT_429458 [Xylariaceae sp. FL1019]
MPPKDPYEIPDSEEEDAEIEASRARRSRRIAGLTTAAGPLPPPPLPLEEDEEDEDGDSVDLGAAPATTTTTTAPATTAPAAPRGRRVPSAATAGTRRRHPCGACVSSALGGASNGLCLDAVGPRGKRCLRCHQNNRVCRPCPVDVVPVALVLTDRLSAVPQDPRAIATIRTVVRFQYTQPGLLFAAPPAPAAPVPAAVAAAATPAEVTRAVVSVLRDMADEKEKEIEEEEEEEEEE